MAGNVVLNSGAGGATLGTDQVAGVDYQIVKISFSTAGSPPVQVDAANGLPVVGTFWQATQPVSAASLPLPAGAATAAGLTTINATLGSPLQAGGAVSVSNFPATQPVSAAALPLPTGAATSALQTTINTTLGTPMQQTGGSLSVTNFPATQPVSATALPLPANAAQETGGNLGLTQVAVQRLIDLNTQILATLQAMQLQLAVAFNVQIDPSNLMGELLQ